MTGPGVQRLLSCLRRVRSVGNGEWVASCPVSGHGKGRGDVNASLSISVNNDGGPRLHCFAGCDRESILSAVGLRWNDIRPPRNAQKRRVPAPRPTSARPITVADLGHDKSLSEEFLRSLGLEDRIDGVLIPYRLMDGSLAPRQRLRTALSAKRGSRWLSGDGSPVPYGLDRIDEARAAGSIIIVEGESDCWALWQHGFPALGIPGASMAKKIEATHLEGIPIVYFFREPDSGGSTFAAGVVARLAEIGFAGEIREIRIDGVKDPADLHREAPASFRPTFRAAMDAAANVKSTLDTAVVLILDRHDPMSSARAFLEASYFRDGTRTLHHHGGVFYAWSGTHYPEAEENGIRAEIYDFLGKAKYRPKADRGGETAVDFKPNRARVYDILDALEALAHLPSVVSAPAWILGEGPPGIQPSELIACRNGLVHLPSGRLFPHSPHFFSPNALPFDFLPDSGAPATWNRFLDDLWDDDMEARDTLQEVFGYLLTLDMRQQKIFLIVGPRRSGKGTIARVLTALLGQANVCAPTLASLGTNFGLAPLIGKMAAIVADARLSGRADQAAVAERLLSISGEDSITVDRKFRTEWTGTLPARFVILTNELPRIADASGALASRFVVLTLRESFLGKEDTRLTDRLLEELAQILNWSIEGWKRLRGRGYFLQPSSSSEAVREIEDLGSPISAFLRERCEVKPGGEIECRRLFDSWKAWCDEQGRDHVGTLQTFGRDLRSVLPGIRLIRPRGEEGRTRAYSGLRLLARWEKDRSGPRY